jgi:hypothetical protein
MITFCDADRWLEFTLSVDYSYRPAVRPRMGWRDGGDAGEPAAVELSAARLLQLSVACGPHRLVTALQDQASPSLSTTLGQWCLDHYESDIEEAVWRDVQARRRECAC